MIDFKTAENGSERIYIDEELCGALQADGAGVVWCELSVRLEDTREVGLRLERVSSRNYIIDVSEDVVHAIAPDIWHLKGLKRICESLQTVSAAYMATKELFCHGMRLRVRFRGFTSGAVQFVSAYEEEEWAAMASFERAWVQDAKGFVGYLRPTLTWRLPTENWAVPLEEWHTFYSQIDPPANPCASTGSAMDMLHTDFEPVLEGPQLDNIAGRENDVRNWLSVPSQMDEVKMVELPSVEAVTGSAPLIVAPAADERAVSAALGADINAWMRECPKTCRYVLIGAETAHRANFIKEADGVDVLTRHPVSDAGPNVAVVCYDDDEEMYKYLQELNAEMLVVDIDPAVGNQEVMAERILRNSSSAVNVRMRARRLNHAMLARMWVVNWLTGGPPSSRSVNMMASNMSPAEQEEHSSARSLLQPCGLRVGDICVQSWMWYYDGRPRRISDPESFAHFLSLKQAFLARRMNCIPETEEGATELVQHEAEHAAPLCKRDLIRACWLPAPYRSEARRRALLEMYDSWAYYTKRPPEQDYSVFESIRSRQGVLLLAAHLKDLRCVRGATAEEQQRYDGLYAVLVSFPMLVHPTFTAGLAFDARNASLYRQYLQGMEEKGCALHEYEMALLAAKLSAASGNTARKRQLIALHVQMRQTSVTTLPYAKHQCCPDAALWLLAECSQLQADGPTRLTLHRLYRRLPPGAPSSRRGQDRRRKRQRQHPQAPGVQPANRAKRNPGGDRMKRW